MQTSILNVVHDEHDVVKEWIVSDVVQRVLPRSEGPDSFFWTSGRDGILRFLGCQNCRYLIHPPVAFCPQCRGRSAAPTPVSGRGTLYSFTVNHQQWDGTAAPYVVGVVELDEQAGLRFLTNIVDIEPDEVRIGLRVEVAFEDRDPIFLPMFRPAP
jgi:uncharacterized protein